MCDIGKRDVAVILLGNEISRLLRLQIRIEHQACASSLTPAELHDYDSRDSQIRELVSLWQYIQPDFLN